MIDKLIDRTLHRLKYRYPYAAIYTRKGKIYADESVPGARAEDGSLIIDEGIIHSSIYIDKPDCLIFRFVSIEHQTTTVMSAAQFEHQPHSAWTTATYTAIVGTLKQGITKAQFVEAFINIPYTLHNDGTVEALFKSSRTKQIPITWFTMFSLGEMKTEERVEACKVLGLPLNKDGTDIDKEWLANVR